MDDVVFTAKQAADYLQANRTGTRSGSFTRSSSRQILGVGSGADDEYALSALIRYRLGARTARRRAQLRFIDLFAGIGGLRMGLEAAGAACVFSSEIDRFAAMTYAANHGDVPYGDITQIQADNIPQYDILVGGFPCQPFSIAGVSKYASLGRSHGFEDPTKGTLFFHIKRLLMAHRPQAFLLENVKNLRSHDKGRTWQVIRETLEDELGYTVYVKVVDARSLVPQHRERVFIVGFRDPRAFQWPAIPDTKPALRDILVSEVPEKYTLSDKLWSYLQDYAEQHRRRGNGFGFGLANLDDVSRTLSARYYKDGSEILIPQDGRNPRRLTPRECARLMGYPDTFRIPVSDTQAYRQFGNSVVLPVVKLVAASMVESLMEPVQLKQGQQVNIRQLPLVEAR